MNERKKEIVLYTHTHTLVVSFEKKIQSDRKHIRMYLYFYASFPHLISLCVFGYLLSLETIFLQRLYFWTLIVCGKLDSVRNIPIKMCDSPTATTATKKKFQLKSKDFFSVKCHAKRDSGRERKSEIE